jgi:hypothetical protein
MTALRASRGNHLTRCGARQARHWTLSSEARTVTELKPIDERRSANATITTRVASTADLGRARLPSRSCHEYPDRRNSDAEKALGATGGRRAEATSHSRREDS